MQRVTTQLLLRRATERSSVQLHPYTTTRTMLVNHAGGLLTTTRRYHDDHKSLSKAKTAPTQQSSKANSQESQNGNPELPKFSLDGLGVSKNMKIFLVVVLSIFGTMETWFYCKAIWRWWKGEQGLAVTADDK
ncbi:hypothetical protein NQ176_g9288 [Zarea fungicola]|uniref:Uncharacterized protein n=1 Tax=Zarea fungicola TaxID=93591 RepID=A0ACC1MPL7_9HYPO|nr:hypothetical protein NQ176_g9288 [Lecanicillium fungicola]